MTNLHMSIKFAEYCKGNKLCFERNATGYKRIQQLWNQYFNITANLRVITKNCTKMRQQGYNYLFVTQLSEEERITILGEHCIKNKIYFDKGRENHEKMKQVYFDCFQKDIAIGTARKYIPKLQQAGFHTICYKKQPSLETRLFKFIGYCKDKSILFNKGIDGHKQLARHWYKYFKVEISILTASKYATKLRMLGFQNLFNQKTTIVKKDCLEFAEYCISKNITFTNNLKVYEDIKNIWDEYFNVDIDINSLKRHVTTLRQNGYDKLFPKQRLTIMQKANMITEYSKKNNIKFCYGKAGLTKIQDIYKYCFNNTIGYGQTLIYRTILINKYKYLCQEKITREHQIKELSEYFMKNNKVIHRGPKGLARIKETWENLFNEKITNTQTADVYSKLRKLNIKNLFQERITIEKKLIEFTTYCINKNTTFKKGNNNNEDIKKLWDELFNENINLNSLIKHIIVIRQTINSDIFPKENISQIDKMNIISNYCINKNIQLTVGTKGNEQLIKIYNKYFNKTISISTASKYMRYFKCSNPNLFKIEKPLNQKIDEFCQNCKHNNITFAFERDAGAIKLKEEWNKFFFKVITINAAKKYCELIKDTEYSSLFIHTKLKIKTKINEFARYCIKNSIKIGNNELIQKTWFNCFQQKIELSTARRFRTLLSQSEYKDDVILTKLTLKDKINRFGEYCLTQKIYFIEGKSRNCELKKAWKKCIKEDIEISTLERYISNIRNSGFKNLFIEAEKIKKSNINIFRKHCINTKLTFSIGTKSYPEIKKVWEVLFVKKISETDIKYIKSLMTQSENQLFFHNNPIFNKNNYNPIAKYCIQNFITIEKDNLNKIQEVWLKYYKINLSTENAKKHMKDFLYEIQLLEDEKWSIFAEYCYNHSIIFQGTSKSEDKVQTAWRNCFDN